MGNRQTVKHKVTNYNMIEDEMKKCGVSSHNAIGAYEAV